MATYSIAVLRTVLFISLLGAALGADFSHTCQSDSECAAHFTDRYICVNSYCKRKFIEFSLTETAGLIIIAILVAMTNSGGVGAGTVISPTLVVMFHFPLIFAIPQARVTITTGALITFVMTGFSRRVDNQNLLQTDYSLAGVITPLLLAGSQMGVIFARWLPGMLISTLLIMYICISLLQTYRRATKESDKEHRRTTNLLAQSRLTNVGNISIDATTDKVSKEGENNGNNAELDGGEPQPDVPSKLALILEQLPSFGLIFLAITTFVMASLMRGGKTIDSIIWIEQCSGMSWIVFLSSQVILLILTVFGYHYNKPKFEKADAALLASKSDSDETEAMTPKEARVKLIAATYLAGIISGFIGVGGGMILGLYMLSVGLDVYASTALSNFIVFISSASTTFQFIAVGAIQIDNSLVFIAVALFGSALGNLIFKRVLKKLGKPSLIVWLLFSVLWLALAALAFEAFTNFKRKGQAALKFGKFC